MSSSTIRTLVFFVFAAGAIGSFALLPWNWFSIPVFVILALAAWIVPGMVFARIATPEEKQRDLEERARNSPD